MYSAKIICDSINHYNDRLTTFLITFPRLVLAEFNTHRMFSRNSASSRAIPFPKMLRSVWKTPFIPLAWMKNHSGMQGTLYYDGAAKKWLFRQLWLTARNMAIILAWLLYKAGLTKQLCNRLLEPFAWHTVLVTATEWENFFSLRAHPDADIHIQEIAFKMLEVYNNSRPQRLEAGEWHMPFIDDLTEHALASYQYGKNQGQTPEWYAREREELRLKLATSRCAQTSYTIMGENRTRLDYAKLINLHDRLLKQGHWSPFEHIARAMTYEEYRSYIRGKMIYEDEDQMETWDVPATDKITGWCGNFRGFIQYRKTWENENRPDDRVTKLYAKNL